MEPDQNLLSSVPWLTNREVGPQEPEALLHERLHAESPFKNPSIGSAEPIVSLHETTIYDPLGFKTPLIGSAEPIVLLH